MEEESNPKWIQIWQINLLWSMSSPPFESVMYSRSLIGWQISVVKANTQLSDSGSPHTPNWNCQLQQITDWLMNVCIESPFNTVRWFTLVLTFSGLEYQFHIATDISWFKIVNALNTATLNLADIEDTSAHSIKHRCPNYQYTKELWHTQNLL